MLKKYMLLIAIVLSATGLRAQSEVIIVDRELSAGVGIAPMTNYGAFQGVAYNLDYCRLINDFVVVGASFVMSGNRLWYMSGEDRGSKFTALMGAFRSNYISERTFKLYCVGNLGLMWGIFRQSDRSELSLAWYGGLGMEFGDLVVFYMEVGAGNKGAISLGMRYRF